MKNQRDGTQYACITVLQGVSIGAPVPTQTSARGPKVTSNVLKWVGVGCVCLASLGGIIALVIVLTNSSDNNECVLDTSSNTTGFLITDACTLYTRSAAATTGRRLNVGGPTRSPFVSDVYRSFENTPDQSNWNTDRAAFWFSETSSVSHNVIANLQLDSWALWVFPCK